MLAGVTLACMGLHVVTQAGSPVNAAASAALPRRGMLGLPCSLLAGLPGSGLQHGIAPLAAPRGRLGMTCRRAGSYKLEAETAKRNAELGRQATCPLEEVLAAQRTDVRSGELRAGPVVHGAVQCSGEQPGVPGLTAARVQQHDMDRSGRHNTLGGRLQARVQQSWLHVLLVHLCPTSHTVAGVWLGGAAAFRHGLPPHVRQFAEECVWSREARLAVPSYLAGLLNAAAVVAHVALHGTNEQIPERYLHIEKPSAVHVQGPCILTQPLHVPSQLPGLEC